MLTDQLGSIGPGKYYLPGQGYGFGLGVAVRKEVGASPLMGSVGDFFWGGAAGTYMAGDPQEDMFLIYMVQSPKNGTKLRATIRNMTYGAITELNRKSAP
jgi:CubicO group peptidase (beta-lactamase class C family)